MQANADVPIVRLPNTIYDVISEVNSTKARERLRVQALDRPGQGNFEID